MLSEIALVNTTGPVTCTVAIAGLNIADITSGQHAQCIPPQLLPNVAFCSLLGYAMLPCAGNTEAQPAEAVAGPSGSNAAPVAPAAEEEGDSIDPEFLAALPPEIQAEVLEQQRRERRMRQRQRQQQEAAAAAAAAPVRILSNKTMRFACAGSCMVWLFISLTQCLIVLITIPRYDAHLDGSLVPVHHAS